MREQIISLLENKNKKSWVGMINRRADLLLYIKNTYPDCAVNEALYLIMTNTTALIAPCGNKCNFLNGEYTKYCKLPIKPSKDTVYCIKCNEHWRTEKKIASTNNCRELYGVEHHFQRDDVKDKIKQTYIERYGVEHNSHLPTVVNKRKESSLKVYGVDNPLKSVIIQQKIKNTNIEKYGVENYGRTPECVSKRNTTMMETYGYINASQCEEFKTKKNKTNLKLYGFEHPMKSELVKDKTRITNSSRIFKIINEKIDNKSIPLFEEDDCKFINQNTKMPFFCNVHNGLFYSTHKYGIVCRICNPITYSTQHNELIEFLTELNVKFTINDRSFGNFEFDLYIPSLKIAIECNGVYWHNSLFHEKSYHQNKTIIANNLGINLIHIFEDEWHNDKSKIKNRLIHNLGLSSRKIPARKCQVKVISNSVANDFLNEYHIQNGCTSKIQLGLFYDTELVSVMTFGKSRFDKKIEFELLRFSSSCNVQGAANKLLTFFEKTYEPKSLISYQDLNWGFGNLYYKLGFKYEKMTEPKYFYVENNSLTRISRQSVQKHKLVKMGYDPKLTESEICIDVLKYNKIYDSGNLKFTKYYI